MRRTGGERGAARRSSGGAAAEAQRSICAGRSSRTIDEETSKRENENEAERAITVRRGRRAARHTSPPWQMRFVGRWRHTSTKEEEAARTTHGVRTRKFWSDMGVSSLVIFLLRWGHWGWGSSGGARGPWQVGIVELT